MKLLLFFRTNSGTFPDFSACIFSACISSFIIILWSFYPFNLIVFWCFLAAVERPQLVTGVKSSGVNNPCTGSLQVFLVCGSLLIRDQPFVTKSSMHHVNSVTYCNCMPDMHRSCKPLMAKPWNKPFKVTLLNYISNPISASWLPVESARCVADDLWRWSLFRSSPSLLDERWGSCAFCCFAPYPVESRLIS